MRLKLKKNRRATRASSLSTPVSNGNAGSDGDSVTLVDFDVEYDRHVERRQTEAVIGSALRKQQMKRFFGGAGTRGTPRRGRNLDPPGTTADEDPFDRLGEDVDNRNFAVTGNNEVRLNGKVVVTPDYYDEIFGVPLNQNSPNGFLVPVGPVRTAPVGTRRKGAYTDDDSFEDIDDDNDYEDSKTQSEYGKTSNNRLQKRDPQAHDQLPHVDVYRATMNANTGGEGLFSQGRRSLSKLLTAVRISNTHDDNEKQPTLGSCTATTKTSSTTTESEHDLDNLDKRFPGIFSTHKRDPYRYWLLIVLGVASTILIFLGIGLIIGENSASDDVSDITQDRTSDLGQNTEAQAAAEAKRLRFQLGLDLLQQMEWTDIYHTEGDDISRLPDVLADPESVWYDNPSVSPQFKALHWLTVVDTNNVIINPDSIHFRQRYALAVLFFALNGRGGNGEQNVLSAPWVETYNFLSEYNECNWYEIWEFGSEDSSLSDKTEYKPVGVLCSHPGDYTVEMGFAESPGNAAVHNNSDLEIERLYLPSNNLKGSLPSELRLLTNLKELNFYNNHITGTIPTQYSELSRLEALVLHSNDINGTIPLWVDKTPYLEVLNLGNNRRISGTIPSTINEATNLTVFHCGSCGLTGNLWALQGIDTLRSLHLDSNELTGRLDDDLFDAWKSIVELDLGSNRLTGTLPTRLLESTTLAVVDLHNNQFRGPVLNAGYLHRVDMSQTAMKVLALQNNNLTGSIEPWLEQLTKLQHLDISNNAGFEGTIPTKIGLLTDLKYLFIAMIPAMTLAGSKIPTEIGLLTNLQDLSFQNINLIGTIPEQIAKLENLILLDFNDNHLSGTIPSTFGELQTDLRFLLLSGNRLSGSIPTTFVNLRYLDTVLLQGNGPINNSSETVVCQHRDQFPSLRVFNADCQSFQDQCSCCTTCCDASDATSVEQAYCKSIVYYSGFDPSSEYHYVRQFYQLNEEDLIVPVFDSTSTSIFDNEACTNSENFIYSPFGDFDPLMNHMEITDQNSSLNTDVKQSQYTDHMDYMEQAYREGVYSNGDSQVEGQPGGDTGDFNDGSDDHVTYSDEEIFAPPIIIEDDQKSETGGGGR